MLLGNNPIVDGLQCTLVDSMKERAFLPASRRHITMVCYTRSQHRRDKEHFHEWYYVECIMGINLDSVWCCETMGVTVIDDMWFTHYLYFSSTSNSTSLFIAQFFLLQSEKDPTLRTNPWCSTLIHSQKSFHPFIKSFIRMGTPNYTGILNLQGTQIYLK